MSVFKWDKSLSVNVEKFDSEHKKLIDMLNEYYTVYMSTENKKIRIIALKQLFEKLLSYTIIHFSNEEEYFDKFKYENTLEHKQKHQEFRNKIVKMKADLDEGKTVYSLEITTLIREWMLEHIKMEDKRYSQCFNDNGLK